MRKYSVKPLDTLSSISQSFYGTPDHATMIWEMNRHYIINPNQIFPGQVIVIPYLSVADVIDHTINGLLA
jgi:nucleoid-associated protein YgaU